VRPGLRAPGPAPPQVAGGLGSRPRRSVTCCRRAPLRPRQTWPLPGRLRSPRTPAPCSALARGPSPRTRPDAPQILETSFSKRARASEEAGAGWEEQPANLRVQRASAGEAARRLASERSFLQLPHSRAATHPLATFGAGSRGPGSLFQPCAPLISREPPREPLSGTSWGLGRGGGGEQEEEDGLPGPLPRPRPPTCARPRPSPAGPNGFIHSFLGAPQIFSECPPGARYRGRTPRGCGERNSSRPRLLWALAVGTRKEVGADQWDSGGGGQSWGGVRGQRKSGGKKKAVTLEPDLSLCPPQYALHSSHVDPSTLPNLLPACLHLPSSAWTLPGPLPPGVPLPPQDLPVPVEIRALLLSPPRTFILFTVRNFPLFLLSCPL
jgi:hypothetical protein